MPPAAEGIGLHLRLRKGEDRGAQGDELQDEQDVVPQALERRVGLQVLDRFLPQQRRRDFNVPPLELEEVEDQQRRNGDRGRDTGDERCEETHAVSRRRSISWRRSFKAS
ncbi:MAG: hypothetical protein QM783_17600 [Phycisphaerales bacterium]